MSAVSRFRRLRRSPRVQIAAGTVVMAAGGYLVALWVVGLMVMVGGLLFCADALVRDWAAGSDGREVGPSPVDRWRNAA